MWLTEFSTFCSRVSRDSGTSVGVLTTRPKTELNRPVLGCFCGGGGAGAATCGCRGGAGGMSVLTFFSKTLLASICARAPPSIRVML